MRGSTVVPSCVWVGTKAVQASKDMAYREEMHPSVSFFRGKHVLMSHIVIIIVLFGGSVEVPRFQLSQQLNPIVANS